MLGSGETELRPREFFKDRFSESELRALFDRIGVTPADVLSTRSRPFQDLGLADKQLGDEELIRLMVAHPALIRRPLVVRGSRAVIGLDQNAIAKLIAEK